MTHDPERALTLSWATVVDNASLIPPGNSQPFNSYNQPSVNAGGLVVFRARSKGGGEEACGGCGGEGETGGGGASDAGAGVGAGGAGGDAGGAGGAADAGAGHDAGGDAGAGSGGGAGGGPLHGVYKRDMAFAASVVVRIADRTTLVPQPNDTGATFIEFPSFPRMDIGAGVYTFRGNSMPVWMTADGRVGTSGVFVGEDDLLDTGASRLGAVPAFSYFQVPGLPAGTPPTAFDVFPGAPAVTGTTIVFKGNYTLGTASKTGDYFRELRDLDDTSGGTRPIQLIADSTSTLIPGTSTLFGSTAPPSAADRTAVFAGFDNEDDPTLGGIYAAPLRPAPKLRPLVTIGQPVPDWRGRPVPGATFDHLGEAVSFDGRHVAFWGAWGTATRTVTLFCPTEGNKARIAYCLSQCPAGVGCTREVPVYQGIFVHDMRSGETVMAAQAGPGQEFEDFVFWNFSGKVPGTTDDDSDGDVEDAEPARWRSAEFVAVDGARAGRHARDRAGDFQVAFKAVKPDTTMGIYLTAGPGRLLLTHFVVVDTTTPGTVLDAMAAGTIVSNMGVERDGFRGRRLAINASMAGTTSEEGWAGIYVTRVPAELDEHEKGER